MQRKFDKEYSTQYVPEIEYLKQNGIRYTFVKEIDGVSTYKYTKTPRLFKLLEVFYSRDNRESDKNGSNEKKERMLKRIL